MVVVPSVHGSGIYVQQTIKVRFILNYFLV